MSDLNNAFGELQSGADVYYMLCIRNAKMFLKKASLLAIEKINQLNVKIEW